MTTGSASDSPEARATLKGPRAIFVSIDIAKESESEWQGLSEDQLRTEVELGLRKAGITVVSLNSPGRPAVDTVGQLGLEVTCVKPSDMPEIFACHLTLKLSQGVMLARVPAALAWATTWSKDLIVIAGIGYLDVVRHRAASLVDAFANAYLEQNPKSAAK